MLRREFPYLEITIEEYCNEFIEKYRNDKNFNKLIRSNVFTPDYMRKVRGCGDFNSNTRCKGQITYVKFNDNNLICNIKVCGVIGPRYYSDDVINLSVNKKSTGKSYLDSEGVKYYNNNIRRNDLIRDLFKPEIIDFLRLFGFNSSKMDFVKIGKIKTVDSIKVSS